MRQLFSDMTDCDRDTVTLHVDNTRAIDLAKNPLQHQRSKHIDKMYHLIRSEVRSGIVNLVYVLSNENATSLFTKPLTKNKLIKFSVIRK